MSKHTPGPWEVSGPAIVSGPNVIVVTFNDADAAAPREQRAANAARIVACVNACEGLPTEVLEQRPALVGAAMDLEKACEAQLRIYDLGFSKELTYEEWQSQCEEVCTATRAALARARGESEGV